MPADAPRRLAIPDLSLARLFLRFLRFGLVAWGGPAAQIEMLRQELVLREGWVDEHRFRRALAVYQALPGPEAHELCCWFGMLARGRLGAISAGLGFMLPGLLLMLACAWLYVHAGVRGATASAAFLATQAAVVGLILRAAVKLCSSLARGAYLGAIALMAALGQLLAVPFWLPLLIGAVAYALTTTRVRVLAAPFLVLGILTTLYVGSYSSMESAIRESGRALSVTPPSSLTLLATGLTGGLVSFGGAYTAIPVVRDVAVGTGGVGQMGWMTDAQFLDGLAIGGVLPSPLVIFGTFVGFVGGGFSGALLMTLGMFAPAFGFTLLGHSLIERLIARKGLHSFLDGVAAAVAGLIAATSLALLAQCAGLTISPASDPLRVTLARPMSLAIAGVAFIGFMTLKTKWAVPGILAAAALAGGLIG
jgi:chromate transporter